MEVLVAVAVLMLALTVLFGALSMTFAMRKRAQARLDLHTEAQFCVESLQRAVSEAQGAEVIAGGSGLRLSDGEAAVIYWYDGDSKGVWRLSRMPGRRQRQTAVTSQAVKVEEIRFQMEGEVVSFSLALRAAHGGLGHGEEFRVRSAEKLGGASARPADVRGGEGG